MNTDDRWMLNEDLWNLLIGYLSANSFFSFIMHLKLRLDGDNSTSLRSWGSDEQLVLMNADDRWMLNEDL